MRLLASTTDAATEHTTSRWLSVNIQQSLHQKLVSHDQLLNITGLHPLESKVRIQAIVLRDVVRCCCLTRRHGRITVACSPLQSNSPAISNEAGI